MSLITWSEAVNQAIAEEMRHDKNIILMGEDVAEAGTPFKVLSGLVDEFGRDRIIDTPISEPGFVGMAVGAAMTGLRPIVDIMFGDFLFLIMDQLANQAAKQHYMSGGKLNVPMVIRTNLGATRRTAAQHSQSLQAMVAHIPGIKVLLPSRPCNAKGLMKAAIRDNNPVVIIEDKMSYQMKGDVPEHEYVLSIGQAQVLKEGSDITMIGTSSMVQVIEASATQLNEYGVSAEIIDLQSVSPLDEDTIVNSVKKTGRAVIVDEGYQSYGITSEVLARIQEQAFYYLDAPIRRIGAMDVPIPFSPVLEDLTVPTANSVTQVVLNQMKGEMKDVA